MHTLLHIRARKTGQIGRHANRPTNRSTTTGNSLRAILGGLTFAALTIGLTLTGVLGTSAPGLRAIPVALPAGTALLPVSADSETLAIRAIERAGERFLTLVGADYQSRLLREKRSFAIIAADGAPYSGGLGQVGVVLLALNPDRSLSKRLLKPQVVRGFLLRELMPDRPVRAAERSLRLPGPNAQSVAVAGPDFTIEFICHLKRATSSAADASDASSSSLHRIVV
jgi:hypothetical protein